MNPTLTPQLGMTFTSLSDRPDVRDNDPQDVWLGLVIDHRQLFDALQSEWLSPPLGMAGRVLGISSFQNSTSVSDEGSSHIIQVSLRFDVNRLPSLCVLVLRHGEWVEMLPSQLKPSDSGLFWPGVLPTTAISHARVATGEEEVRLIAMARQVSNVPLPPLVVRSGGTNDGAQVDVQAPSVTRLTGIALPPAYDAVRGAAALGWWALPRVDPWLNLLVSSFTANLEASRRCAVEVEAPWLIHLPWAPSDIAALESSDAILWPAALRLFCGSGALALGHRASDLVSTLEADFSGHPSQTIESIRCWADETRAILRADLSLAKVDWRVNPVGRAIQLVLARPHPEKFKRWLDDLPAVPPRVWWTGALLCGLLQGYSRLPVSFRGESELRRFLALSLASADPGPALSTTWRRSSGSIVFEHAGICLTARPEHSRGKWFNSDLSDSTTQAAATDIVKHLNWPCIRRVIDLAAGKYRLDRAGAVEICGSLMSVSGEVRLQLVDGCKITEVLDVAAFRRCLAVEGGGPLPAPPESHLRPSTAEGVLSISRIEPSPLPVTALPGLMYIPGFLTEAEELDLVAAIDQAEWLPDLKRRVQHYGWKYDYSARRISRSMQLGPLPVWADGLARRLADAGILPWIADQVIVNEYKGNQGIGKHIDCIPCFEEAVSMISLLESWEILFRQQKAKLKIGHVLERRSAAVMTGDARYRWTHEIPARMKEPSGLLRERRISVTFRKVRPE